MRALILSAGLGERLRPLTLKRAKPALEFLNVPMLGFPYYWLSALGLQEIVFNTHYLPETIRHAAMHVVEPEVNLRFTHEAEILGSGGGIWNARFDLMGDRHFAVANGDGVIVHPNKNLLKEMLAFHDWKNALATLLVCPLEGVGEKIPGVWVEPDGLVRNFGKSAERSGLNCYHYASFMFFNDRIWPLMPAGPSNILYDVLKSAIDAGDSVYAYKVDDLKWFETGAVSDYLNATEICLKWVREQNPLGERLLDIIEKHGPTYRMQSDLSQLRLVADSAQLNSSISFEGFQVIGTNAKVGQAARLNNSVVLADAQVGAGELVKQQVII